MANYKVIDLSQSEETLEICGRESFQLIGSSKKQLTFKVASQSSLEVVDCSKQTSIEFLMEDNSALSLIAIKGSDSVNRYNVDILGSGIDCNLRGVIISSKSDNISIYTNINHLKGGSNSEQLFKIVGAGDSKSLFEGKIYIATDAQQTTSLQQNKNILLSENARILSRPWLEIYADDVKCSHGSSTGKLSADEIFYMRQRGLNEEVAKKLQLEGFALDVVDKISDSELLEIVNSKVLELIDNV